MTECVYDSQTYEGPYQLRSAGAADCRSAESCISAGLVSNSYAFSSHLKLVRERRPVGVAWAVKGEWRGRHDLSRRWDREFRGPGALRFRLRESLMSFDYAMCVAAGAVVLIYLIAAMLRPDKF
jgi:hypothetical protein